MINYNKFNTARRNVKSFLLREHNFSILKQFPNLLFNHNLDEINATLIHKIKTGFVVVSQGILKINVATFIEKSSSFNYKVMRLTYIHMLYSFSSHKNLNNKIRIYD